MENKNQNVVEDVLVKGSESRLRNLSFIFSCL